MDVKSGRHKLRINISNMTKMKNNINITLKHSSAFYYVSPMQFY